MNDNDTKQTAIINAATEQFRALLETNFRSIAKAAQDGFIEDEDATEPFRLASASSPSDSAGLAAVSLGSHLRAPALHHWATSVKIRVSQTFTVFMCTSSPRSIQTIGVGSLISKCVEN